VLGTGSARADARHLALEFLHPVIVGKRAVPALALAPGEDPRAFVGDAATGDVAIAVFGSTPRPKSRRRSSRRARRGLLAIALRAGSSPIRRACIA
jgi:D-sedoheptulose 7-phosphate isomerase